MPTYTLVPMTATLIRRNAESVIKISSQYNYSRYRRQAEQAAIEAAEVKGDNLMLMAVIFLILMMAAAAFLFYRKAKEKKQKEFSDMVVKYHIVRNRYEKLEKELSTMEFRQDGNGISKQRERKPL
jgi:hypothetical protein